MNFPFNYEQKWRWRALAAYWTLLWRSNTVADTVVRERDLLAFPDRLVGP